MSSDLCRPESLWRISDLFPHKITLRPSSHIANFDLELTIIDTKLAILNNIILNIMQSFYFLHTLTFYPNSTDKIEIFG